MPWLRQTGPYTQTTVGVLLRVVPLQLMEGR